jgi:hypothetical protein
MRFSAEESTVRTAMTIRIIFQAPMRDATQTPELLVSFKFIAKF